MREARIMEQLPVYAECMRSEGIDMPDPVLAGGSIQIGLDLDDAAIDSS